MFWLTRPDPERVAELPLPRPSPVSCLVRPVLDFALALFAAGAKSPGYKHACIQARAVDDSLQVLLHFGRGRHHDLCS